MRIVFMGTPDFAVPTLAELAGHGHEICAVYTRAPKPAGRGLDERKSPVHDLAERLSLPVFTPRSLRSPEAVATFQGHQADLAVIVAYGLILPPDILAVPPLGCFNVHASLLPRWRGAAPIHRAVMAGDTESGVCVMRMEEGLDTGPVAMAERVAIGPDMTAGDLHDRLSPLGADLMARAVAALSRDALRLQPQPEDGITYAHKIGNEDARIDWRQGAAAVHDQVRGLAPFPGSFFEADLGRGKPERVKVLRAERAGAASGPAGVLIGPGLIVGCGDAAVRLLQVQRAGKAAVSGEDFLRGTRLVPGSALS